MSDAGFLSRILKRVSRTPTSVVNAQSTIGSAAIQTNPTALQHLTKSGVSGSVTANTLKTLLSLSGPGRLDFAAVTSANTTSRTHRMKITLDGISPPFFDSTTAATTTLEAGIIGAGAWDGQSGSVFDKELATFNTSCLVEFTSSNTENNGQKTYLRYQTY